MWISKDENSFNFVAPVNASAQENNVNFPYFEVSPVAAAASIELDANFAEDVKDLGTLTGNTSITVVKHADLKDGAKLYLKMVDSGGAGDVVTLESGFAASALTLTTGKIYVAQFILIGGAYYLLSHTKQN